MKFERCWIEAYNSIASEFLDISKVYLKVKIHIQIQNKVNACRVCLKHDDYTVHSAGGTLRIKDLVEVLCETDSERMKYVVVS